MKSILTLVYSTFLLFSCLNQNNGFKVEQWKNGWEFRVLSLDEVLSFQPELEDLDDGYAKYNIPHVSLESNSIEYYAVRKYWNDLKGLSHPSLYLRGLLSVLNIYCGKEKIISQFEIIEDQIVYNREFFPVVSLPKSCAGNHIYIVFFSRGNLPMGFTETPVYSDATANYKSFSNHNQTFASLGFFFWTLGLFSLYLYGRRKKKPLLAFTLFSVVSGIHFLSQVGFFGYFYYENATVNFYIFLFSLFIIPISCLYFFDKLFGVGRWNVIRMLWQFHILFTIVILLLAFTETISITIAIITFVWVCIPSLILQVIVAWGEVDAGKPKAWLLVLGASTLFVLNGHDVLAAMGVLQSTDRLSQWGFFFFVLSLTLYGENIFRNSEVKFNSLQKEIVTAARIQNAILPPIPPHWEDVSIEVYYKPSHEVGGDFYDFQALGSKKYGLLIADVVGHGLGASIIASLSKFAFFQNFKYWTNPSFLLSAMNDCLVVKSFGRFTTATYFYLDMERRRFLVSSAGHPSFFHWKEEDKKLVEIKPKGKPLGILPELVFFEEEHSFGVGDRFLFYTDGLTEEENEEGTPFGSLGLKESLVGSIGNKDPEVMNTILSDFQKFTNLKTSPHDDVTLICLHILK
ncbi:SpoIIE family protein phosphatase [Leptospira sp. 96542]|nr:SpoIIE family protein phosphatase [Leptospira sp. 96542]